MERKIIPLLLLLLIARPGRAQTVSTRLDSLFRETAARDMFNGNVLVAQHGRVIYQQSFGYSDFEQKRPNDSKTGFQLASLSKVLTAIAVLQQYEKGKLNLDDYLTKYFPAFPYKDITISQLLSHTSGLSDQELTKAFTQFETKNKRRPNNNDLVSIVASAKPKRKLAPGQKWWYCNLGYELLATLVERTSGMSFDRYLSNHVFKPAGMTRTYVIVPGMNVENMRLKANNYDYEFRYSPTRIRVDQDKPDYTENTYGHSNVVSTTGDLLKLDQALYTARLVKPQTLKRAFAPAKLADGSDNAVWMNIGGMGPAFDGLGWFIFKDQSAGKTVWHAGGMQGAVTILLRNIDRNQTVIMLDNNGSEGIYKTALNALQILNNRPLIPNKKNLSKIYGRALMGVGVDHASSLLLTLRTDTAHFNLTEDDMNNLGYAFLAEGQRTQALETFKVNCLLYPSSDNVYNSYGEALLQAGQNEDAIAMYRKSLVLNPGNEDSRKALKQLQKRH